VLHADFEDIAGRAQDIISYAMTEAENKRSMDMRVAVRRKSHRWQLWKA
jgi:hypothetical protein